MKRVLITGALLGTLLACTTKQATDVTPVKTESIIEVPYRHSARLVETPLEARISQIVDSRCPMNARCITAGSVVVTFALTGANQQEEISVDLPAYTEQPAEKVFTFNGQRYRLKLHRVLPYPEVGSQPELTEYTVQFSVGKES